MVLRQKPFYCINQVRVIWICLLALFFTDKADMKNTFAKMLVVEYFVRFVLNEVALLFLVVEMF